MLDFPVHRGLLLLFSQQTGLFHEAQLILLRDELGHHHLGHDHIGVLNAGSPAFSVWFKDRQAWSHLAFTMVTIAVAGVEIFIHYNPTHNIFRPLLAMVNLSSLSQLHDFRFQLPHRATGGL